ncbi:MAG TPA: glycosyltransferase, partial [Candidatus Hydrogenedentes bacterium]|nr:glycosyltransferase [Candidatus Hydrogenedentota bacterium]
RGDAAEALDRRALLWRAEGYVRTTLWLMAPRVFPQSRFLEETQFRKERELFADDGGMGIPPMGSDHTRDAPATPDSLSPRERVGVRVQAHGRDARATRGPRMKVLLVHNRYRLRGGEDAVVETTLDLLRRRGDTALLFDKHSDDAAKGLARRARAVFSGIYSPASRREMARLLDQERPDVVHVHNLFPLLSPSVLVACRRAGVPVVMTCHNYRLVCPIAVHFIRGAVCDRCAGGREYWCFLWNCRDNRIESAAYALRGFVTRSLGLFLKNITLYLAISEFLKTRLIAAGVPEDRIEVVPNMISLPDTPVDASGGAYVAFAGRASEEKGIPVLLDAAR